MTYLEKYWDMIQNNEVVVGYWIRKEVSNLIRELKDERYVYKPEIFERRKRFQESLCLQSKAPYYGVPIKLLPWQCAFFEALYGFYYAENDERRFTEGLLEIARKNGKSTIFAADANTDLFIGEGGVSICTASNDDRQAKLIWKEVDGMRKRLDTKDVLTKSNLTEIKNKAKDIEVVRLSSKTQNKDGFNFKKVYMDESHDMMDNEIAEACWRAMSSQEEPLFLNCTTEGFVDDGYLDSKLIHAKKVIEGEIDDDRFLPFLYVQDNEQEVWQDESSWEKSNPSIRYGVKKIDKLRRDIQTAKFDKATRIHLLTKDFNIKQNNASAWLMTEDYDYPQEVFDLEDFRGCMALGAVDLSATTDLSNAKLLLMRKDDKTKYVLSHYWIPESKLTDSDDKEAGAKYAEWARDGYLTICEGNEIDISQIADWFANIYKDYGIRLYKCGYDQRYAKTFLDRMDLFGFECEMIYQNRFVLTNPMKLTEAELKSRCVNFGNNPIDKWCLGNASMQMDNVGNVMCVKIANQASKRIDGAVTLIMLYEEYRRCRSEFMLQLK